MLREHPDAVEADLSRFYGIDIRDRWLTDALGRPRLTLRMMVVRLRHLPLDSAVSQCENEGEKPWERVEHQLDEIRRHLAALGGDKNPKPDPGRRLGEVRRTPDLSRKVAAACARRDARLARLAAQKQG